MGEAAQMMGGMSITVTYNDDGTGSMKTTQTFSTEIPATQAVDFEWEIEDGQIEMSYLEAGSGMVQKMRYEFDEDGALSLKMGGQPAMKYKRVEQ
jgi:hypothetical protein